MGKITTIPIKKRDVEKLTTQELRILAGFGKNEVVDILKQIAADSRGYAIEQASSNPDIDPERASALLGGIARMKEALDFLLDAPARAKEELKERKKSK